MGLRAQIVSWRTLRSRVERDGSLDGEPLYRVREVRMVLAADGKGFRRVVACSNCGRLRVSRRRVTAADVKWSAPELCSNCAPEMVRPMDLGDLDRVLSDDESDGSRPPDLPRPGLTD